MPLSTPDPDSDDRDAWMEHCMGHDAMLDEFPDPKQRAAVCMDIWRRRRDEKAVGHLDLEVKFSVPSEAGEFVRQLIEGYRHWNI
jgi:hypothetical protein